mmetsp:Transcript_1837/g.7236  ORF Transcript_1837/g.7236 Transcript_1837/m.7236 type:complete len:379 (-) Transcript_1837:16-1152(-)
MSARFVAAMTIIPVLPSKPSISVRSWFNVCSRSSLPPPTPVPRERPTASISSTKMMHGAFSFAFLKRSRTRDAPTPTNISTNSEPEMEKNGTPASPAIALASKVLPVPGGPTRRHPFGILAPTAVNRSGRFKNSTISMKSFLASFTPATSSKVTPVFGSIWNLALDLPNAMGLFGPPMPPGMPPPPPPCWRRVSKNNPPTSKSGNAKLPSKFKNTCPLSSVFVCAAKSTFFSRNFLSNSEDVPGSCTRTRCTRLPSSGETASTIAIVPCSYKSTFFTRPMSRYSRNREYDMREDATSSAALALCAKPNVAAKPAAIFNASRRVWSTFSASPPSVAAARGVARARRARVLREAFFAFVRASDAVARWASGALMSTVFAS